MRFLFFLIILGLIGGGGFILFYKYEEAMISLQKENHLLKNQLFTLRDKYNNYLNSQKEYSIEFLTIDHEYGVIPQNAKIYLYPNENSPVLQSINIDMNVTIVDKAISDNLTWYYVALPTDSNINSRGWVLESSFADLSSPVQEVCP